MKKLALGIAAGVLVVFLAFSFLFTLGGGEHGGVYDMAAPRDTLVTQALSQVDRALDQLQWGNVAYNAPKEMRLDETGIVRLVLAFDPLERLRASLPDSGQIGGERVRLGPRMEGRLTGGGFEIHPITPALQAVSSKEPTEWRWSITASHGGEQDLHLSLIAHLHVAGESLPKTMRTFDETITVNVTWHQHVAGFVRGNWEWLWVTIVAPLGGWLWRRRSRKHGGSAPASDSQEVSERADDIKET